VNTGAWPPSEGCAPLLRKREKRKAQKSATAKKFSYSCREYFVKKYVTFSQSTNKPNPNKESMVYRYERYMKDLFKIKI